MDYFFLIIYILFGLFYTKKIYFFLINHKTIIEGNKVIYRKKVFFEYWSTILIQLYISIGFIIFPTFHILIIKNKNPFLITLYISIFIFIISILHGIYLSITKTKNTILGKVYWKRKDAKMFKRVIVFKLFFSIVTISLIVFYLYYLS